MQALSIEILGIPSSKQSARFRIQNVAGKMSVRSYQKQNVVDKEKSIAMIVQSQLPKNFIPFDCPLSVEVTYVFPPPKSLLKNERDAVNKGMLVYKSTKPDLTDNLNKMMADSLDGIVYVNDSRIAKFSAMKVYGLNPRTELLIKPII